MKLRSLPRLLVGGAVIFVGVGFLLDGLDVWEFGSFMATWWPILIVLAALASFSTNPQAPLWPLFVAGAATLLLLNNTDVIAVDAWQVIWPAAVIVVGLSFFLQRGNPMKAKQNREDTSDFTLAFSGVESVNKSSNYTGGKINVLFGGVDLDLRQAEMKGNEAVLDIFVAFGGVELKVPKDWVVHVNGLPLFGGWEDSTEKPTAKKAPVLEVRGTCLFGGVEVKN